MTSATKYITDYSWRTIVRNVIVLTEPNTYRASVDPIDLGNPGALLPITSGMILVDNAGHLFPIIGVGTGTIDVKDELLCGECPASGLTGIVCKTANKGRALLLPQGLLQYLDKSARSYLDSVAWSVLWANDPNPKRIKFTNTDNPALLDYQTNYADDYGPDPKVRLMQILDDGIIAERTEKAYRIETDGLIQSIRFANETDGLGEIINCYIEISR